MLISYAIFDIDYAPLALSLLMPLMADADYFRRHYATFSLISPLIPLFFAITLIFHYLLLPCHYYFDAIIFADYFAIIR
jgi:hypothetical protein